METKGFFLESLCVCRVFPLLRPSWVLTKLKIAPGAEVELVAREAGGWAYNIPSSGPMGCYSATEVLLVASGSWGAASAQVNQGDGLCPLWPHCSSKCGGSAHSTPTASIFLKKINNANMPALSHC